MPVVACLLRAVNVGGNSRMKMDLLRDLCTRLGFESPRTYVQSGNVVFGTKERNLARIASVLEDAIENECGFRPDVMVRTAADLRRVIATNPFAGRNLEPSRLLVTFLATPPGAAAAAALRALETQPDEVVLSGSELYAYYPNGVGRSKTPVVLDKAIKIRGTARNWNSVTKLLEIAEAIEAEQSR